jgi:hypothetical protein
MYLVEFFVTMTTDGWEFASEFEREVNCVHAYRMYRKYCVHVY